MDALAAFFHMGGYAAYIWPAFGLAAVVLIGFAVQSRRALKADQRTLDLLQAARRTATGRDGRGDHP